MRLPGILRRIRGWRGLAALRRPAVRPESMAMRILHVGSVGLMLFSIAIPLFQQLAKRNMYSLDAAEASLVGETNANLSRKISFDSQRSMWQFNKDGNASAAAARNVPAEVMTQLKAQAGGGGKQDQSLYSVDLPVDPEQGVTYYDNNTNLSFNMTPQFKLRQGSEEQGRLIYPLDDGKSGKLVYTSKNNGMKEDIILEKSIGDTLQFTYELKLPNTLEAKLQQDGSLAIMSADPALFGAMSYGSDSDQAKIESARQSAPKDHAMFVIPAPVIVQTGGGSGKSQAAFSLDDTTLTVRATGLEALQYPVTIDPSVVITSSSDFQTKGNNEGSISYDSNQVARAAQGGGMLGGWTATSTLPSAFAFSTSVTYNGYIYTVSGGAGAGSGTTNIYYAVLNSNGTVGTWASTSSTFSTARAYAGAVAYNGYMYVYGGYANGGGTSALGDVQYAPIDSNGNITTTWQATSSMDFASCRFGYAAHNGYLYAAGGSFGTVASNCGNSTTPTDKVQYAPINGDGTVGTWQQTTVLNAARHSAQIVAYNDCIYVALGTVNGTGGVTSIEYSCPTAGAVASWTTITTSFSRYRSGFAAYNGYMYATGGNGGTTTSAVIAARILAGGGLGEWQTTASMVTARGNSNLMTSYNGFMYVTAGTDTGGNYLDTVEYAPVQPPGVTAPTTTTTGFTTARNGHGTAVVNGTMYIIGGTNGTIQSAVNRLTVAANGTTTSIASTTSLNTARHSFGTAAYNGYIYAVGGLSAGGSLASVEYAQVNTSGSLNAWATTTSVTNARYGTAAIAHAGYLYVIGGYDGTTYYNDVQYAPINANGTVGTWTATTSFSNARYYHAAATHNGYLYVIGGYDGTTYYNDVQYAPINANGTVGTWSATSSFTNSRYGLAATVYNGYIYLAGGINNTTYYGDVQYAQLNANGTLGTWASTETFSNPRRYLGLVAYNGYLYEVGGNNGGTNYNTVNYAQIQSGGSGALGTWTVSGTALATPYPNGVAYTRSVAHNGYVYIVGGLNSVGSTLANVYYASINIDGSLGTWTSTNSLNQERFNHALVVHNNYVYAVSGANGGTNLTDYEYAPINTNGTLGTWTRVTSGGLPVGRTDMAYATYNGYLYIYGGDDGTNQLTDVYYAAINTNGTLGTWTSSTAFTDKRKSGRGFAYNGYLYLLGGQDGATYYNDVQYVALNSGTGALSGSWAYTTAMPVARSAHAIVVSQGYVYTYGGTNNQGGQVAAMSAQLGPNGHLNVWQHTTSITNARINSGFADYNGTVYQFGGYNSVGPVYYQDVQYAPVQAVAKKASYSKLIDLGGSYAITGIAFNGSLPGGLSAIKYRTAGTNGTFGSDLSAAAAFTPASCTPGSTRYIWLHVSLDNGDDAILADALGAVASASDITVSYDTSNRPAPSERLFGGKFFRDQVLRGHDTCGP